MTYWGGAGQSLEGIPIISFAEWQAAYRAVPVFISIGSPSARKRLASRIEASGGHFATFAGGWPSIAGDFVCGEGTFVTGPAYIGTRTVVGRHGHLQPLLFLGHDVRIGDFVTISSARIAGYVHIEDEVFIGVGAAIMNGTTSRPIVIGRGATVGVGAVVTKSVRPGVTVMGNPARDLRTLAAERRGRR